MLTLLLIICWTPVSLANNGTSKTEYLSTVCALPNDQLWSIFYAFYGNKHQWHVITTNRTWYSFGVAKVGNPPTTSDWSKENDVLVETGGNVNNQANIFTTKGDKPGISILPSKRGLVPPPWEGKLSNFQRSSDRVRLIVPGVGLLGLLFWTNSATAFSYFIGPDLSTITEKKEHQLGYSFNIIGSVDWPAPDKSAGPHLIIHNQKTGKLEHHSYKTEKPSSNSASYTLKLNPNSNISPTEKLFICKRELRSNDINKTNPHHNGPKSSAGIPFLYIIAAILVLVVCLGCSYYFLCCSNGGKDASNRKEAPKARNKAKQKQNKATSKMSTTKGSKSRSKSMSVSPTKTARSSKSSPKSTSIRQK